METDIFEPTKSRADLVYNPKVKELQDVMELGNLTTQEGRDALSRIISNYIVE